MEKNSSPKINNQKSLSVQRFNFQKVALPEYYLFPPKSQWLEYSLTAFRMTYVQLRTLCFKEGIFSLGSTGGQLCIKSQLPETGRSNHPKIDILLMAEIRLTTWDVQNLKNNGINYLSTGAGSQPSTISSE